MQEITLPQSKKSNQSDDNSSVNNDQKPKKISVSPKVNDNVSDIQTNNNLTSSSDQTFNNISVINSDQQPQRSTNTSDKPNIVQNDNSNSNHQNNQSQSVNNPTDNKDFAFSDQNSTSTTQPKKSRSRSTPPKFGSNQISSDPFGNSTQGSFGKGGSPFDNFKDPWGTDPWGSGGDDFTGGAGDSKKLSPKERVKMIEEVYSQVLGRDPDTRDINYYKYSTLGPEEIKAQLLEGKEHQQLMTDGREFKKMKERAESSEVRVKSLEGQIRDQIDEYKYLSELLKQKNSLIQELRSQLNNPYNMVQKTPESTQFGTDLFRDNSIANTAKASDKMPSSLSEPSSSEIAYTGDHQSFKSSTQSTTGPQNDQLNQQFSNDPTISVNPVSDYSQIEGNNGNSPIKVEPYIEQEVAEYDNSYKNGTVEESPQPDYSDKNLPKNGQIDISIKDDPQNDNSMDKDEVIGFFDSGLEDAFNIINKNPQSRGNNNASIKESTDQIPEHQIGSENSTFQNSGQNNLNQPPQIVGSEYQSQDQSSRNNQNLVFSSATPVIEPSSTNPENNQPEKNKKLGGFLDKVKKTLAP